MYNGIINIYKEKGFTSHDVVAKLRGILKQKKIGHTGTLDPLATGVLAVCVGRATKLVDYLTNADKTYIAEITLGIETDTLDLEGSVLKEEIPMLTDENIFQAVMSMKGKYEQEVPIYSAIKVNGKNVKPSYDVKLNDEIELYLGRHHLIVKVTNIREFANKDQAESMFEVLKDG